MLSAIITPKLYTKILPKLLIFEQDKKNIRTPMYIAFHHLKIIKNETNSAVNT